MKNLTLIFICISILAGCDLYQQDEYQEFYVVESYLVAGDNLPSVLLSTTSPIEKEYRFKENAISEAEVEIRRLSADSSIEKRFPYRVTDPGIFIPTIRAKVHDQQLYQLFVRLPDGHTIEAKTYVPKHFSTTNTEELVDPYTYQSSRQIMINTTPSDYITGRQTYYVFTVNAVEPDSAHLTPFYRDLVLDEETNIKNFYVNSSGIINEANYELQPDRSIALTVPWIAIAFYGPNKLITSAIDDNMYDFLRSQDAQGGGPTISPGMIQNIRYHVSGGIGIFGSLASDTNRVTIEPARP